MLNFSEIVDGEEWELFCRDFFEKEGFYIETTPDRGADGGKDFLITEIVKGKVGHHQFRWLVSCKHNALGKKKKAVNEQDEPNILERLAGFNADGFIGAYTTISSSGLNNRLTQLKLNKHIKDFKIYDHKIFESILLNIGYADLLVRYMPETYKLVKPLHTIFEAYEPLNCELCQKDLLLELTKDTVNANIVWVTKNHHNIYEDVYVACQACDTTLQLKLRHNGFKAYQWNSLNDLMISANYLQHLMATLNHLYNRTHHYSEVAFKKEKIILLKIAQKVMREMNEKDKERFEVLSSSGLL